MSKDYSKYTDYQLSVGALNRNSTVLSADIVSSLVNDCYVVASHSELPTPSECVPGDVAVVTSMIGENASTVERELFYCAGNEWQPLSGHMKSGNVYFDSNLSIVGDWLSVDGILNGNVIQSKGQTLDWLLSSLPAFIDKNTSKVTVNSDPTVVDLSIYKVTNDQFADRVLDDEHPISSNEMFIIEDDYIDCYGQDIRNVLSSNDAANAATVGQVDAAKLELCAYADDISAQASRELSGKLDLSGGDMTGALTITMPDKESSALEANSNVLLTNESTLTISSNGGATEYGFGQIKHTTSAGSEEVVLKFPEVSGVVATTNAVVLSQFKSWYPNGSVENYSECTPMWDGTTGLKCEFDEQSHTAAVYPFARSGENTNTHLTGRVVIPPYAVKDGQKYEIVKILQGTGPFSISTNLTEIVAPTTITDVGSNAFDGCQGLVDVYIPGKVTIHNLAFSNCIALKRAIFPSAIEVGDGAFFLCHSLVDVDLNSAETFIQFSFNDCNGLKTISLPSATDLGAESTFLSCTSLTEVHLPKVESLGNWTFNNCSALEVVDFGDTVREQVPTIGANSFANVPNTCTIVVPDKQYDAWIAAPNWATLVAEDYKFLRFSEWKHYRILELGRRHFVKINNDDTVDAVAYNSVEHTRQFAHQTEATYVRLAVGFRMDFGKYIKAAFATTGQISKVKFNSIGIHTYNYGGQGYIQITEVGGSQVLAKSNTITIASHQNTQDVFTFNDAPFLDADKPYEVRIYKDDGTVPTGIGIRMSNQIHDVEFGTFETSISPAVMRPDYVFRGSIDVTYVENSPCIPLVTKPELQRCASNDIPAMDSGDGSAGSSNTFSRGDHVHPSDASKRGLTDLVVYEDGIVDDYWQTGSTQIPLVSESEMTKTYSNGETTNCYKVIVDDFRSTGGLFRVSVYRYVMGSWAIVVSPQTSWEEITHVQNTTGSIAFDYKGERMPVPTLDTLAKKADVVNYVNNTFTYAECTTNHSEVIKIATTERGDFTPISGSIVAVRFSNFCATDNATLSIDNYSEAKPIYARKTSTGYDGLKVWSWSNNSVVFLKYMGDCWLMVSPTLGDNDNMGLVRLKPDCSGDDTEAAVSQHGVRQALSAKLSVDNIPANVNIVHISQEDYEQLVFDGDALSNTLYVVSGDCINAYGETIQNVVMTDDPIESEAATQHYVDAVGHSISTELTGLAESLSSILTGQIEDKSSVWLSSAVAGQPLSGGPLDKLNIVKFDSLATYELCSSILTLSDLALIDEDQINAENERIISVADPVDGTDAANKRYVDGMLSSISTNSVLTSFFNSVETGGINAVTLGHTVSAVYELIKALR